jgi:hypothetical protein
MRLEQSCQGLARIYSAGEAAKKECVVLSEMKSPGTWNQQLELADDPRSQHLFPWCWKEILDEGVGQATPRPISGLLSGRDPDLVICGPMIAVISIAPLLSFLLRRQPSRSPVAGSEHHPTKSFACCVVWD